MNADDDGATALADEGMCGWPSDEWFIDRDWGDDRPAEPMQCTAGPTPGDDR